MRRSVLASVALLSAFLTGCEDGPNQTYSPAPGGAAGAWNNGGADASTNDPGTQGFDAGGGGTNAVNICTAAEQQVAWSKAFTAPLFPPFQAAGIDLSAGGTFSPITIDDVQRGLNGNQKLCQGFDSPGFCLDGSGSPGYAWGESYQVATCYDIASHQITFWQLFPGYDGEATFTLPATVNGQPVPYAIAQDGTTGNDLKYVWHIGKGVTENGQVLDMQWGPADAKHTKTGASTLIANKLFLGMTYTYNPALIAVTDATLNPPLNYMTDPGFDCLARTLCRTSMNPDGSGGNFGARTVALYADFALSNSTDPASASAPSDIYMFNAKYLPYSFATYNVGLDTFVGPNTDPALTYKGAPIYGAYTPAGILSPSGSSNPLPPCTLYMGSTWADFKKNCVQVTGDSKIDTTALNKLLGGQHHGIEWFTFFVNGQNQNFSANDAELTQNGLPGVLLDSAHEPSPDDVATDLFNDIRSYGFPLNDLRGDQFPASKAVTPLDKLEDVKNVGQDLHGSAAILGYYRQLVYDDLRNQLTNAGITPVADPTTCWTGGATTGYVFPDGCTGFEMMVTSSMPMGLADTKWQDKMDLGPIAYRPATLFRSGDPTADFMADPSFCATRSATSGACKKGGADDTFINGVDNLLQGSLLQVVYVVGHGNVQKVPSAARDWRYFLKFWGQAYTKYLLNRSKNPTWHDLYTDTCKGGCKQINQDALFFDLNNGLDKFEYNVLLPSTNVQSMNFYQRLEREEKALYTSMLEDKTKAPGSNENVNVSDLFGAPAIANAGLSSPSATHDAWYCATHGTPATPDSDCSNGPPTDSAGNMLVDGLGRPLFTNYHGVFTGTQWTIGNTITIQQTLPFAQGAIVKIANYDNPYDTTTNNNPITTFSPHLPSQPGVGFEIPINAQRSQFIQTGALDFGGVTVTFDIDYLPVYDSKTGALTGGTIAAVETQDFLGEVWPCVDPASGDILRVKMYTSTLEIQDWLDGHPGTRSACNIFVRMSPYNNYPDYIVSNTNGVILGINPGAGGGPSRVADVTIFNPGLLTQTQ